MRRVAMFTGLCLALALASTAGGTIIYVDDDAPPGGDGRSWATAYRHLQDALGDARTAAKPVEVRVALGVYKADQGANQTAGDRLASFGLISGVALKGGYAGIDTVDPNARDIRQYETVLSGDLGGNDVLSEDLADFVVDPNEGTWARPNVWNILIESTRRENSVHVLVAKGTDKTAALDGFTVTGGNAYHPPYWFGDVPSFDDSDRGGAMLNKGGSPVVKACTFIANSTIGGGSAVYAKDSEAVFTECDFVENFSWGEGGAAMNSSLGKVVLRGCAFERNISSAGVAVLASAYCHHEMTDCRFSQNGRRGGDARCVVSIWQGDGSLDRCQFEYNALGAVAVASRSNILLQDCKFMGNTGDEGGGINCSGISRMKLNRCTFVLNEGTKGGGLFISSTELSMNNCLFSANQAKLRGGGALFQGNSTIDVRNSLFWNNRSPAGPEIALWHYEGPTPSTGTISYCLIEGGQASISNDLGYVFVTQPPPQNRPGTIVWASGNVDADPLFADPNRGDYHLKSQAGRWDQASSNWAIDDVTSPCIDAGDPATPIGYEPFPNGGRINVGPYGGTAEASKSYFAGPTCETVIAGDINGDCRVDFLDLAILAYHWLEEYHHEEQPQEVSRKASR